MESYRKIGFIKYYPIYEDDKQSREYHNLYFNIVDNNTKELVYETYTKIKSFELNNYEMLFNPIISLLSGDYENTHTKNKIKLIFDIDCLFICDGTIDYNSNPYLINAIQSKVSCKVCGICKKVVKHITIYDDKLSLTEKWKNNIYITHKNIKEKIGNLKTIKIMNEDKKEYMRVININSNRQPSYRFIIPSLLCDCDDIINIISDNIVYKQLIFEYFGNSTMKEIIKA